MKRIIAIALAVVLCCGLFITAAFAEESDGVSPDGTSSSSSETVETTGGTEVEGEEDKAVETSPAGPDPDPVVNPETGAILEDVTVVPDELGKVSFVHVESRMRKGNLQVLALQENVDMLESIDYDDLKDDLREQLNEIAQGQWFMVQMGQTGTLAYEQMDQAYDAIREQFDAIKDGEMQEDNAGTIRQLKNLQDQIVMGGEATYVALSAMEIQESSLQRQLTAMNRTVEEMELRYQMGQISSLQLSQAKAGQTSLASGLETLRMNIRAYKAQLELLLGVEMTGEIELGPVPTVTEKQLEAMDLEKDLAAAKEKSYALYDAAQTLEDEREDFKDNYSYNNSDSLSSRQAWHTWQSAQYTYQNTVQNYELRFRNLYAQVNDYKQIWEAAKVSLESQRLRAEASELKYEQGTISYNQLLDARDELTAAEETVQSASNDLFSAYNTYCWAVQHGILN